MNADKKIIILAILVFLLPTAVLAEVYIGAEEATKKIFPGLTGYKIENRIVENQEFKIFTVFNNGEVIGWTVALDEMGKIKPITFLVGIDTQGEVLGIFVLEYRDMFGSEIKRRSFLKQFRGKSSGSALSVGRDIDVVTGATISSKAAASAVKKALKLIKEKFNLPL